ncbi:hypothetical protein BDR03DRAFT_1018394 [Suillus americanus]|nr:hypothetical protein BDR03DRAFT_1018394 [Suillus americanus]
MAPQKGKGKGTGKQTRRSSSYDLNKAEYFNMAPDFNHRLGLNFGFNASSSINASLGVDVPDNMQLYNYSNTTPNPCFTAFNSNLAVPNPNDVLNSSSSYLHSPIPNFAILNPNLAQSNASNLAPPNFAPFHPPNINFSAPDPNIVMPDTGFAMPNPTFALSSPDVASPNIVAPRPQFPPNTTDLKLMVESFQAPPFWRNQRNKTCILVLLLSLAMPQAGQVGFEGKAVRISFDLDDAA